MTALQNKKGNIFLRMHPLQRILLSIGMSAIIFLFIRGYHLDWVLTATVLWDTFAFSFIITSWIIFLTQPVKEIIKHANKDDGSRLFVLVSILVSSFASMFTVLLLMTSKGAVEEKVVTAILSIIGMIISWALVHTIFTFHYAHMYYFKEKDDMRQNKALGFPGDREPDYLDFAYFAFVIGMTFQVSDVEITSHKIRKTALAHGLLAFALNTFVVALTINLIAGLKK